VSPIGCIELKRLGDLALPAIAIGEQARLVVVELLARLGGELEIRPLDDGVHRAGLLAEPAGDAFHHVDVVARGAPGAVVAPRTGLDRDRLRRADRLAKLAGNAALLAVGIAAQGVLAAKTRRQRTLLERIVEGGLGLEKVAHRQKEGADELLEEQRTGGAGKGGHGHTSRERVRRHAGCWPPPPPLPMRAAETPSNRGASAGRSDSAARMLSPWRT